MSERRAAKADATRASRAPRVGLVAVVAVLGVLSAAPTPGDVGGCGSDVRLLDRDAYARARKKQDCQRCEECGVRSERCARSCDVASPPETVVPASCRPLLHDGVVCLRARADASCATFARYVDDTSPTSPSECMFCKATASAALERAHAGDDGTSVEDGAGGDEDDDARAEGEEVRP